MSEYTKNGLWREWRENVKEIISENIENQISGANEVKVIPHEVKEFLDGTEITDGIDSDIWSAIDSSQQVIYTWRAIEVSKAIGQYDAFDFSDITGERFENWSQVAFENLHHLIYQELDFEELMTEAINERYARIVGPFPVNS